MFQVSSQIEQIKSLADGTWQLKISTQELTPEQVAEVASLKQKQGWFLFKENEIEASDIPNEEAPEFKTDKSPSQRLRAVLYIYWSENTGKTKSFDLFYKEWMNKKIEEIKNYLPSKD